MKKFLLCLILELCTLNAWSQTSIVSDAFILGNMTVATGTALGRMTVVSSVTNPVFQVSGVDLTPFLRVSQDGKVGLSTYSAAHLDITGSADNSTNGLMLYNGNQYGSSGRTQITFGVNGSANQRHAIQSVHLSSTAHNSLEFLVWTPDAGTTSIASMTVMSLVTVSSISTPSAMVHVRPAGDPNTKLVELLVSNGSTIGGGTIHVAAQVTPSSRLWKTDISYLTQEDNIKAYENVRALKPVSFRYMKNKGTGYVRNRRAPLQRGLLYEDVPENLRGPGEGISLDQRLLQSEMAFQEMAKRLEKIEVETGR